MTLPQGWAEVQLGNVCDLLNGRAYKRDELLVQGKYRVLRVGNFFTSDKWYYSDLELEPEKYCDTGDLLYAWSASFGPKIWSGEKVIYHYHIWRTRPHPDLADKNYLFHWFNWDKENIKSDHGTGSTMIHVTKGDMEARQMKLPPLAEQRRIVAKLDALTARLARARAELDRVPVLAANLRQSAVANAFEGHLTTVWRAAQPGLTAPSPAQAESAFTKVAGQKRRKPASAIDWQPDLAIPDGWRWASVDELVAITQYGSSAKTSDDASGVPVLRMGNIQRGEIDWSSLKYLPPDHAEFPDLFLQAGDVLFNRTNSFELVGKSAVFRGSNRPVSYASYLIRLRCSAILPDLLVRYVNSQFGRAWVDQVASQQVGQANVNGSKLKALGVPLPPPAEQVEMLRLLDIAFARADRLEAEATRARALLDRLESALLAKAFRGELVPQDPSDEPAEALLDRIRTQRAAAPAAKQGRRAKEAAHA